MARRKATAVVNEGDAPLNGVKLLAQVKLNGEWIKAGTILDIEDEELRQDLLDQGVAELLSEEETQPTRLRVPQGIDSDDDGLGGE